MLPTHNDPALKALLRELHFGPATGDGNSFEDWMYTWWFFELRNAHHADLGSPKAWLKLSKGLDFYIDDGRVEDSSYKVSPAERLFIFNTLVS